MKQLLTIAAVIASVAGTVFAGPAPSFKKMVVEPRPEIYGLGWYGALQAGMNVFQDLDVVNFTTNGGNLLVANPNSSVGGFGGAKVGYVFNTGRIRPAVELDLFYSGFGFSYSAFLPATGGTAAYGATVNSFAYIPNLLIRFDLGRFQPYVGGGIGGYFASSGLDSLASSGNAGGRRGVVSNDSASWAWQIIAGADYYFSERFSLFGEYKYLNYEDFEPFDNTTPGRAIFKGADQTVDQHLVGIGVRLHF
jgi:opacity protein-like surface antigen